MHLFVLAFFLLLFVLYPKNIINLSKLTTQFSYTWTNNRFRSNKEETKILTISEGLWRLFLRQLIKWKAYRLLKKVILCIPTFNSLLRFLIFSCSTTVVSLLYQYNSLQCSASFVCITTSIIIYQPVMFVKQWEV